METYALDTNCFIDAVRVESPSYGTMQRLLAASEGIVCFVVSLQTIHELEAKKDEAWKLAKTLDELPHWPIGSWKEQVGSWEQETGSWGDGKRNDEVQTKLKGLAKSGTDIRDRGAYIDALRAGLKGFLTSDKQLVGAAPQARINKAFATIVLTPQQLADELGV